MRISYPVPVPPLVNIASPAELNIPIPSIKTLLASPAIRTGSLRSFASISISGFSYKGSAISSTPTVPPDPTEPGFESATFIDCERPSIVRSSVMSGRFESNVIIHQKSPVPVQLL